MVKQGILALATVAGLLLPGSVQARTSAEATAIVMQFNTVFGGALSRDQLAAMMSEDFIEHHPPQLGAPAERTKSEFISRFAGPRPPRPAGAPPVVPPKLVTTVATEDYVLLMTKRDIAYSGDPAKTFEQFAFDLFRLDAAGKVAEHWDNFSGNPTPPAIPPAPAK